MTHTVITAERECSVQAVAVLMRERNVGSVVLVDGVRPVGFITDRDIALAVVADGLAAGAPAGAQASTPLITAVPDLDVEEAAERMIRHGVRRLVVVEGGLLAGVVTLDDIVSRLGDRASVLSARIRRAAMPARGET